MSKSSKKRQKSLDPEAIVSKKLAKSGKPESARDQLRQDAGFVLAYALHPADPTGILAKAGLSSGSAGAAAVGVKLNSTAPPSPLQPGVPNRIGEPTFPGTPAARPSGILDQALKAPTPDVSAERSGGPGYPPVRDDNHNWMLALMEGATLGVSGGPTGDAGIPGTGSIQGGHPGASTPRRPTVGAPRAGKAGDTRYAAVRSKAGASVPDAQVATPDPQMDPPRPDAPGYMSKAAFDAAEIGQAPPLARALLRQQQGLQEAYAGHPAFSPRRR